MTSLVHAVPSRLAAAAVALALSGVPQLVERPEHAAGHRCQCPVRGTAHAAHACDCPACHAEAARLGRTAGDESGQPPCHRAMAAKVRTQAERFAQLTSGCGSPAPKLLPPPATERFLAPQGPALTVVVVASEVPDALALPPMVLGEPETPPPRAGGLPAARG